MIDHSPQQSGGSKSLLCNDITARCHNNVWLLALVIRGPVPNAETLGAVLNSSIDAEVLEMQLLIGNDYVDVVLALEAVIHGREETVTIRRKVDTYDLWALVGNDVKEAWILMREAVVVCMAY